MTHYKIDLHDEIKVKESLAIAKSSGGKQTGISVVEDDREFSSERQGNVHSEQATIKMSATTRKEEQEIQVAYRLLPAYNKFHNTDYESAKNVKQNDSVDVICSSASGKYPILNLQVRVSDDVAVGTLIKQKSFSRDGTGSEIFCKACFKAIDEKSKKYSQEDKENIVLALDGWPVAYPDDFDMFRITFEDYLKKTGFKEIWYVGYIDSLIAKLH